MLVACSDVLVHRASSVSLLYTLVYAYVYELYGNDMQDNNTPLFCAAQSCNSQMVQQLLSCGADPMCCQRQVPKRTSFLTTFFPVNCVCLKIIPCQSFVLKVAYPVTAVTGKVY